MASRVAACAAGSRALVVSVNVACSWLFTAFDSRMRGSGSRAPLQSLGNWDGEHFVGIARTGYTHEHSHAFFPGLPMAMRAATYAQQWLSRRSAMGVTGIA